MGTERKIVAVDQLGHDTILVYLADGTVVELTGDQLMNSGLPRYPVPLDEKSFQAAITAL
ncbi:MAG: hypothetical protein ACRYGF_17185 [Janthinobacterium lividum]